MDGLIQLFMVFLCITNSPGWQYIDDNNCPLPFLSIVEYHLIENSLYIFFSERVPWQEAKLICLFYEAQLATVDTPIQAKHLAKKIADSNIDMEDIWTGGHKNGLYWIWLDKTIIPTEPLKGFPPWIRNPNRPMKECLAMDRRKHNLPLFVDLDCLLPKPFMCQKYLSELVDITLTPPSQWVSNGNSTFALYNNKLTWFDAAGFCRSLGYRLAIIENNKDIQLIAKAMLLSRPSFENIWIAGYHYAEHWRWLSTGEIIPNYINEETGFPPWYIKHLNRTAGCLLLDRHLTNVPTLVVTRCNRRKAFICEKYKVISDTGQRDEFVQIDFPEVNYLLFLRGLTWFDAVDYCKVTGGKLAEIEHVELIKNITVVMEKLKLVPNHVWIGGKLKRKKWVWIESNKSIHEINMPWCDHDEEDPGNSCLNLDVKLHGQIIIYGLKCHKKQAFICMYNNSEHTVTTSRETTAIATTTPLLTTSPVPATTTSITHSYTTTTELTITTSTISSPATTNFTSTSGKTNSVLTTITSTTTTVKIETTTTKQTCSQSAIGFEHKAKILEVFFTRFSYQTALEKCKMAGGILAKLNDNILELIDIISNVEDADCIGTNFWVNANANCSELSLQKRAVEVTDCATKNGIVCEIKCQAPMHENSFNKPLWQCEDENEGLTCQAKCREDSILVGPNEITCTNSGWVTDSNKTTYLPSCLHNNAHLIEYQRDIIKDFAGFLFIVAESFSITVPEWWIQLEFIAAVIQEFPLSLDRPMGLIIFSSKVMVPIPYNATDSCKVLDTIYGLSPSEDRTFTYYKEALEEANRQIKKFHPNKKTLIFFISENDNNGDEFDDILNELHRTNFIISVGVSTNQLSDLNIIASMKDDTLAMYKFSNYKHFQEFISGLLNYSSKSLNCLIKDRSTARPTTTSRTTLTTRRSPITIEVCNHPAAAFHHNSKMFEIFFASLSYKSAEEKCKLAGGILTEIDNSMKELIEKVVTVITDICKGINLWVNGKTQCSQLNQHQKTVEVINCLSKRSFICEIECKVPKSNSTVWNCEDEDKHLKCDAQCQQEYVLLGPDENICTNVGWVTNSHKTAYLPYCQNQNRAAENIINTIELLSSVYTGFLFIVDESYSVSVAEWLVQLQLVKSLIQVFPLSLQRPMGLLLFSTTVSVHIPYNATNTCDVLTTLARLNPTKERDFTRFKQALIEASKQIRLFQPHRKSFIFFISDGDNNGDDFDGILEELKENNLFISIGISREVLSDLNMIASMANDRLLLYKFKEFEHFKNVAADIGKRRSKTMKCTEIKCKQSSVAFHLKSQIFEIFFTPASYKSAISKCNLAGGVLAEFKNNVKDIVDKILMLKENTCHETEFWVSDKSQCSRLSLLSKSVEVTDCLLEQSFICKIACNVPKSVNVFNKVMWNCEKGPRNVLKCEPTCQQDSVLLGSSEVICTHNGWVTNSNKTTYLPYCQSNEYVIQDLTHTVQELEVTHRGFLFIIDESHSITIPEWSIQLQFVTSLIQIFPVSTNRPMGVIMFSRTPLSVIPYNATATCEVLEMLHNIRPNKQRDFTYFRLALEEARAQIKNFQPNRKTLIFFLSNGHNTGEDYTSTLNDLKKNNTIISIGIGEEPLSDLDELSSMKDNRLLMYKFLKYEHLKKFTHDLQKKRSKSVQCPTRLYTLPKNVQCHNQSTSLRVDGITYVAFFTPFTYQNAKQHCKDAGGHLATVKNLYPVANAIMKQAKGCMTLQLWIDIKDQPCAIFQMSHVELNNSETACSRKHGFICEVGCSNPPTKNKYVHNSWNCKRTGNIENCFVKCKAKTAMVGSSIVICSTEGWVTLYNYTTFFPICLVHKDFESYFMMTIRKLKSEHDGFLFIFDRSYYRGKEKGDFRQLEFMEVILNIFPPSVNFPVGLILFDEDAKISIAYNATNFCENNMEGNINV